MPLAIAAAGAGALSVGVVAGGNAIVFGAVVFVLAGVVAMCEAAAPTVTWTNAIGLLILVIWFIPIKLYSLPVNLPFNLEIYRLFLLLLVGAWLVAIVAGRGGVNAAGQVIPLVLLGGGALGATIVNYDALSALGESEALKPISYFLSFLLAFLIIASTITRGRDVVRVAQALVIGGSLVALAALYDSRSNYNVFDHLDQWFPFFEREPRDIEELRGGRLRVYASAQHPIALGCALTMILPLAIYLASQASSKLRQRLWLVLALVSAAGALTTISRTTVIMLIVMGVVALWLRGRMIVNFLPLLLLLPFVVHFVAPGALGGLYNSFFPKEGLVADLNERAGEGGSGRFADIVPGFDLWAQSPIVGKGIGSQYSTGQSAETLDAMFTPGAAQRGIIFDNQYMLTLVELGTAGIVGTIWFIWGAAVKLGRAARRRTDPPGDLMAACAVSCAGFGAGIFFFDAFSFVQATLVFFVIAALGLRARELAPPPRVGLRPLREADSGAMVDGERPRSPFRGLRQ